MSRDEAEGWAARRAAPRPTGQPSTELDQIDRSIIEHLQHDGRMPFTRLATAVGLSEAAVRQRVQRLLDGDVMQVVAVTNPLWLAGRRMAMIGIKVHGPVERLAAEIEQLDGVEYLVVTAGSFDLLCEAVVADDTALLALTNELRAIDGVAATETFVYLDLVKQTFQWGAR
ncbi:MAG: Lrp/AsnC family transcriptional regulator [Ilumatobacteraceae bacterium]